MASVLSGNGRNIASRASLIIYPSLIRSFIFLSTTPSVFRPSRENGEPIASKPKEETSVAPGASGEGGDGKDGEEGDGGRGSSGGGGGRGKCPFLHNTKHDMKPSGSANGGRCPFAG